MVIPSDDTSIAQWIVDSLLPFETYLAGSVVPPGYDAYARILHPARSTSGYVSWAEIATWAGRTYHPAMQFESIATPVNGSGADSKPWDGQVPYHLPLSHTEALARILRPFTISPEKIWYLVWDGYGSIPSTSRPRVQRPHRNYLLYCGGIDDAGNLGIGKHQEPPEYWFPDDKSWCVATDVDLYWTYVGGSKACINAILNSSELESVPAELSHGLTVDSDIFNRLSPDEKKQWGY